MCFSACTGVCSRLHGRCVSAPARCVLAPARPWCALCAPCTIHTPVMPSPDSGVQRPRALGSFHQSCTHTPHATRTLAPHHAHNQRGCTEAAGTYSAMVDVCGSNSARAPFNPWQGVCLSRAAFPRFVGHVDMVRVVLSPHCRVGCRATAREHPASS